MTDENRQLALELLAHYRANSGTMAEAEADRLVSRLEKISPDPYILEYLFHPEGDELTDAEIVDKAFGYKPIIL